MRANRSKKNPECPAIAELADTLERVFPKIMLLTTNDASPGTRHTSGVAIDIAADVTKTDQRTRAHHIMNVLVAQWSAMRWSDLIYSDYDGQSIRYFHIPAAGGYGGKNGLLKQSPYTDDTRHSDHIHLDWVDFSMRNTGALYQRIPYQWSPAAKTTGFGPQLEAALRAAPSGGAASTAASPAAAPSWLQGWWQVDDGNTYYYFFDARSQVRYTKTAPARGSQAMQQGLNDGRVTVSGVAADTVVIDWNPADGGSTRETFKRVGGRNEMSGTSNRYAPLYAKKMF
jgi:hypothetical protein